MHSSAKGYIYAFLSTLLFAFGYIINFSLMQSMSPESAAFLVFGIGSLLALALSLVYTKKADVDDVKKHWKPLLALGVLNSISAILWFLTLSSVGPAIAGFLFRFVTIFTVIFGVFLLREKFSRGEAAGMLLVVAGAFVITYTDISIAAGAVLAVAGSLCFALMGFVSKTRLQAVRPVVLNNVRILVMFSLISAYAFSRGSIIAPSFSSAALALLSALFVLVIGFLLFFKALNHAELSKVAVIGSLEPFFILILSFLVLQRMPTPVQMLGGFIIMLGTGILLYFRKKPTVVAGEI